MSRSNQVSVDNLCAKLPKLTTKSPDTDGEEDDDADDEEGNPLQFQISIVRMETNDSNGSLFGVIQVQANFGKAKQIGRCYTFSDSGADSWVLGAMAGNICPTGCFADLVGYDPESTKTPRVPIVSGMLKVLTAQSDVPVVLDVHQAPHLMALTSVSYQSTKRILMATSWIPPLSITVVWMVALEPNA